MKTHTLKIKEEFWDDILFERKKCEIRKNDRKFKVWDLLEFIVLCYESWDYYPQNQFVITHVLHFPDGLKDWYVALSISPCK